MRVNITKRVQTLKGRRYCPVVTGDSGHIQPDWVIVNGNHEEHPEGCYYLEWHENGQRKRHSVGSDATVAFNSKECKIKELEARVVGLEVRPAENGANRLQLRSAMTTFLGKIERSHQGKTWQGYKVAFDYFLEFSRKNYVEDIQRTDLLNFKAFLHEKKNLAPRTVGNKLNCVKTFFDAHGMPKLLEKSDMPQYAKGEVKIFGDNQLIDLYRVCSVSDRVFYDFMLMTGFREQEAKYVTWDNIRFGANVVEMRWKPQFKWSPETFKEREVPVPNALLNSLESYRKSLPLEHATAEAFIFSTESGRPDLHLLRTLKRNARRAGLEPADFSLHKFRATFAITHLRAGVDARTVMAWMGQTAFESINRYLKLA